VATSPQEETDMIDWKKRLETLETLTSQGHARHALFESATIIEEVLRELHRQVTVKLPLAEQKRVLEVANRIGRGRPPGSFTLGQIVGLIKETNLLSFAEAALRRNLPYLANTNFDTLVALRNRTVHEGENVSEEEAKFFVAQANLIVKELGLIDKEANRTKQMRTEQNHIPSKAALAPGDSRLYATVRRTELGFVRILKRLHENWNVIGISELMLDPFDDRDLRLGMFIQDPDGTENANVDGAVKIEADENDLETYLIVIWYGKKKRIAKDLAQEVARTKHLQLPGSRSPAVDDYEWYIRELPCTTLEQLPLNKQTDQVMSFVKEAVLAVWTSGILTPYLPTSKQYHEKQT
jgi:hypothetical protein